MRPNNYLAKRCMMELPVKASSMVLIFPSFWLNLKFVVRRYELTSLHCMSLCYCYRHGASGCHQRSKHKQSTTHRSVSIKYNGLKDRSDKADQRRISPTSRNIAFSNMHRGIITRAFTQALPQRRVTMLGTL